MARNKAITAFGPVARSPNLGRVVRRFRDEISRQSLEIHSRVLASSFHEHVRSACMTSLKDFVIEAHGGLPRWREIGEISADLVQGGALGRSRASRRRWSARPSRSRRRRSARPTSPSVPAAAARASTPIGWRSRTATAASRRNSWSRGAASPATFSRRRGASSSSLISPAARCGPISTCRSCSPAGHAIGRARAVDDRQR